MSIGAAIFVVAIIGFAIYSQGFRRLLLWLIVAVGLIITALFVRQSDVEHQEQQKARIQAEEQQRQSKLERQEVEQLASQLCPDLGTQNQCMEEQRTRPPNWLSCLRPSAARRSERQAYPHMLRCVRDTRSVLGIR